MGDLEDLARHAVQRGEAGGVGGREVRAELRERQHLARPARSAVVNSGGGPFSTV